MGTIFSLCKLLSLPTQTNVKTCAGDVQMGESELWEVSGPLVQAQIQAAARKEEKGEGQEGQGGSQKGKGGAKGQLCPNFFLFL
jgi:hypothetical protein